MKTPLGALYFPKLQDWNKLYIPYIYKEIYLEGIYVDIVNGKKDMVIIDLGANIGCTAQYFRDYAKKVYAVEPSTENFDALKMNKEYNGWDNVEVFKLAIAEKDGEMTLGINEKNHTMHSLVHADKSEYNKQSGWTTFETVKVQTLKTFMNENNIDTVDFIKMDIEGKEDEVLRSPEFGEIASRIKSIEIEMHDHTFPELVRIMQQLGFTARRYPSSAVVILFTR